jgi:hypothetical protein
MDFTEGNYPPHSGLTAGTLRVTPPHATDSPRSFHFQSVCSRGTRPCAARSSDRRMSSSASPPYPRTKLQDGAGRRDSMGPELLGKLDDDVPACRRSCCRESRGEGVLDARHRCESSPCSLHFVWPNVGQLARTYVNSRRLIRPRVHVSPRRYAIWRDSIPGASTDCRARESGPARSPVIATGVLRPGARGHGRRTRPSDTRGRFPARPPIAEPARVPVCNLMGPAGRSFSQGHGTPRFADRRDHPRGRGEEIFAASWDQPICRRKGPGVPCPPGGPRVERPGSESGFVPTTARVAVGRCPCPTGS